MGKKKARKKPDRPLWEIDWDAIKTFEDLLGTISEFKLILESPVGNREEDITDDESIGDSTDIHSDNWNSEQYI